MFNKIRMIITQSLILSMLLAYILFNPSPAVGSGKVEKEGKEELEKGFSGEMALIPAGEFIMGSSPEKDGRRGYDFGVDEEPRHTVYLKAFYIDRYEVSVAEYKEYLTATGREWIGETTVEEEYPPEIYLNQPEMDKHPATYISWHDANEYCKWKGKRLPTEAEWEKAARGTDGRRWVWGNEFDPSKAHVEENKTPGWTVPTGSYPEDKSSYGVYDMTGNVSEWTSSYYLPYPGNPFDDGRYTKNAYVLKGASFLLPGRLYGRPAARSLAYPEYNHRMYGIRCAREYP